MTRHCWQKKKSDINTLSGIFDFKAKVAEMIHLPPLGRNIQHVARPGTQSGQLHERAFFRSLLLVMLTHQRLEKREWDQKSHRDER